MPDHRCNQNSPVKPMPLRRFNLAVQMESSLKLLLHRFYRCLQDKHRCKHCTIDQRRYFGEIKTSFSTGLTNATSEHASVQWRKTCTLCQIPTATIWAQRDRFNRCLPTSLTNSSDFLCSGHVTAMRSSPPYYISWPLTHLWRLWRIEYMRPA